jgi:Cu/Ag efflux pump CusA
MIRKLVAWPLRHPLPAALVGLSTLAAALLLVGTFAYRAVQARRAACPTVVAVVAAYPAASAEEVEHQVTIPLEVALAGMPGLRYTRSQSLAGLSRVCLEFESGTEYHRARQEVINRLQLAPALPDGVAPQLAQVSDDGELFRYTLSGPQGEQGRDIYSPHDLKSLQTWTLAREWLRVPGVAGVASWGGAAKRYEIRLDPERLRRCSVSLRQVQDALAAGNANFGGDFLNVRGVGLIGGGRDPMQDREVQEARDPGKAAQHLRAQEALRLRELRQIVVASVNGVPVHIDDVVEGGPPAPGEGDEGVVVGSQPSAGKVGLSLSKKDAEAGTTAWTDQDDMVQGVVELRPGEDAFAAAAAVRAKAQELNRDAARLLPGVQIDSFPGSASPAERKGRALWVCGTFPDHLSPEKVWDQVRSVRATLRGHAEVDAVVSQTGRPDDDASPSELREVEFLLLLKPPGEWPRPPGGGRPRTAAELARELWTQLSQRHPGVEWTAAEDRRDPLVGPFSPLAGEQVVKIFGPELEELERLAEQVRAVLGSVEGVEQVRVFRTRGDVPADLRIDREKCSLHGISLADVRDVILLAAGGKSVGKVVEGEKTFDITLCWPRRFRLGTADSLDLAVDSGRGERVPLKDLIVPAAGEERPAGGVRPRPRGPARIYREQGVRMVAVTFRAVGRKPGQAAQEAQAKAAPFFRAPYRPDWGSN